MRVSNLRPSEAALEEMRSVSTADQHSFMESIELLEL